MGTYFCAEDKADYIVVVENRSHKDNRFILQISENGYLSSVFLSAVDAQRLSNELNQLLMEVKGNE